jgi:hypothetical protein
MTRTLPCPGHQRQGNYSHHEQRDLHFCGECLANGTSTASIPIDSARPGPIRRTFPVKALAAFAGLRGIPCPPAGPGLADSDAVVLVVHAAALLAVLDAEAGTGGSGAGGDVLGGLLAHERRYWQQSLTRRVSGGLDPDVVDRVVTAGFLVGAADQEAAMRLLAVIPDLADGQLRGQVARWLHDLYPVPADAGGEEWIGQLQPDLLTERLAVSVLGRHGELIPCLFADLGQARAIRALTVLARAALTQPAALPQIQQALGADPGHLLVPAIAVTTTTNPALASLNWADGRDGEIRTRGLLLPKQAR